MLPKIRLKWDPPVIHFHSYLYVNTALFMFLGTIKELIGYS